MGRELPNSSNADFIFPTIFCLINSKTEAPFIVLANHFFDAQETLGEGGWALQFNQHCLGGGQ